MKINGYFILDGEVKSFHVTDPKRGLDNVLFERARPRGEWVKRFDGNEWYWYCTSCKTQWYEEDLYMGGNEFPDFCPNCGASMSANDKQVTGKLDENTQKHYGFRKKY